MRSLETTSCDIRNNFPVWHWETNAGVFPKVTATAGGCSDCWKLRRVAGEAHNVTENTLSIWIIFSLQLQQTETSDRKLFFFQHGLLVMQTLCNIREYSGSSEYSECCPEVQSAALVLPCGGVVSLAHHHCCRLPRWTPGPVPLYQMSLDQQQSLPNLVIDCWMYGYVI